MSEVQSKSRMKRILRQDEAKFLQEFEEMRVKLNKAIIDQGNIWMKHNNLQAKLDKVNAEADIYQQSEKQIFEKLIIAEMKFARAFGALEQIEREVPPSKRKEFDELIESLDPESVIPGSLFIYVIAGLAIKKIIQEMAHGK